MKKLVSIDKVFSYKLSSFFLIILECHIIETDKESPKIEGMYEITRAFGFHGDMDIKKFVTYTPSVRSVELDENCACVIIATKGLWKFLSHETVCELVLEVILKERH